VYDGHGGAEVAQYCADKFPEFLKNLETYKNGQLEVALKDAFLGFDKTLLDPSVVGILKELAGEHNFVDDEEDYGDDEDLAELQEESNLPLNEVLEKYKGLPQTHDLIIMNAGNEENLKLFSPYLRGRRAAALAAEAVNKAVMDPKAQPDGSSTSAAAAAAAKQKPMYEPTDSISNGSTVNQLYVDSVSFKNESCDDQIEESNEMVFKQEVVICSEPMGTITREKGNTTESNKLTKSESNDISKVNRNGQSLKSELTISSTSNDFEKVEKKYNSQEDESTDDDDYEENDLVESPDISSGESSEDCAADDDEDVSY